MNWKICPVVLAFFSMLAPLAAAQEEAAMAPFEGLLKFAVVAAIIIVLAYTYRIIVSCRKGHYGTIIGNMLVYFAVAAVFFSITYPLDFVISSAQIDLDEFTFHVWGHLFFYSGMLMFIVSAYKIKNIDKFVDGKLLLPKDKTIMAAAAVWLIAALALVVPSNTFISQYSDTIIDTSGLVHFIAFAFGMYAAFQINSTKSKVGKLMRGPANRFLAALFLLGFIHFWELLTESWGILAVPEIIIEPAEWLIFIGAMAMFVLALKKISSISSMMQSL